MTIKNESLTTQVEALQNGSETAVSLSQKALMKINTFKDLNAIVSVDNNVVLDQARASDDRRKKGKALSPIDGIPIAVKDNYLTKDYPTTACSNAKPLEPSDVDATIIKNLKNAGAIIFAKTNMHEWAYGATNTTSNIGVTKNPHNEKHITGGSSGGSGAAVASGIVSAALGSDTGGSVRIPSSACGIYGFKPSYGRSSRYGILPLSWSLDAPGPMTTELEDIINLMPYFLGEDSKDSATAGAMPLQDIPEIENPKILHLVGSGFERSDEVNDVVVSALKKVPSISSESELSSVRNYFSAWEAILHCEASAYHENLLKENAEGFSSVTRAHLEAGKLLSGTELLKAQKWRSHLMFALENELSDWDALILPTLPVPAPLHGEDWQEFGGRKVTTQDSMTWFCWIGNLAGLPCVTLPVGKSELGLPIGLMLMGKPGQDERLLAIARYVDTYIKWDC